MQIKDLRKVDVNELKKLDFAKIQEEILAKPDIAVNVVLVLLSLLVVFQIFASLQKNLNDLKGKLENSEKKGETMTLIMPQKNNSQILLIVCPREYRKTWSLTK